MKKYDDPEGFAYHFLWLKFNFLSQVLWAMPIILGLGQPWTSSYIYFFRRDTVIALS